MQAARTLLQILPHLGDRRVAKSIKSLRARDPVEGPRACAWLFNVLSRQIPAGSERNFFRDQADIFAEECSVMKRLRKGWRQFGEDDYWWVVHDQTRQWLPRYHSEPTLGS